MKNKPFAWSFSVIDMFEVCAKKFWHLKREKDFKDADSSAARDGKYVHEVMRNRVIDGIPLPIGVRPYEKIAARFADAEGAKHGEMKLALNKKFEPRDFFAKDVWVRAIVDLLIVRGDTAIIVDWKTGKKKERWDQLRLAAAILSRYMPEINHFTLVYVWLKDSELSKDTIEKDDLKSVWMEFLPRVNAIVTAINETNFPAQKSGLCGWCPVETCPHWVDRSQ